MVYPVTPTEFPTKPKGLIDASQRLRFVTFEFTGETTPVIPNPATLTQVTKGSGGLG